MKVLLLLSLTVLVALAEDPPAQDYGYFTIEKDVSAMFYWLYRAEESAQKPLILWLQGGPGGSSLLGDFMENGPLDTELQPRNTSWTSVANVLYVDNPVGTGMSYSNTSDGFVTTDAQIAADLVTFFEQFFDKYPEFQKTDFWMFCESYGGKMTAVTAEALLKAIDAGRVKANLKGVALGDGWLDPIGAVYSYAPYLYTLSLIDMVQYKKIVAYADAAASALRSGDGAGATDQWNQQQEYIGTVTGNVNWYNVLNLTNGDAREARLNEILGKTGAVRKQLGDVIPPFVDFGSQSQTVFEKLQGAFMKPAISSVDYLISSGISVNVYSGQLDLIVDVLNTVGWIRKLNWAELPQYETAPRRLLSVAGTPQGFVKNYKNLSFWEIMRAGHMVPMDNGPAALSMVKYIISGTLPDAPPAQIKLERLRRTMMQDLSWTE